MDRPRRLSNSTKKQTGIFIEVESQEAPLFLPKTGEKQPNLREFVYFHEMKVQDWGLSTANPDFEYHLSWEMELINDIEHLSRLDHSVHGDMKSFPFAARLFSYIKKGRTLNA